MIDVDRPFRDQIRSTRTCAAAPRDRASAPGISSFRPGIELVHTTRKLFGVAPDDRRLRFFLSLLDAQDRDRTAKAMQQSIDTGCNFDVQYRCTGIRLRVTGCVRLARISRPDGALPGSAAS
jgi:two-component system sensor kinase FixL